MIDFERGAKTTGSKFCFNVGDSALLEFKLINQMINYHVTNGYKFVIPPYLVKRKIGEFAGQLPRFEGDYYMTTGGLMLIPTSETALVGMHSDEIFQNKDLPIKYVAFSPCFRREAGTYGKRDKGLKRVHQFHKIELFRIERPEDSAEALEEVKQQVVDLLEKLGVEKKHIRLRKLGDAEKSPVSNETWDVEILTKGEWLEISSISNTGENQSKPALIRYRSKENKNIKCHLLNGSGVALPRLMIYLMEK